MEVLTSSGYKHINDINIGDVVIGKNGVENTLLEKRLFKQRWFIDQKIKNEWKWFLVNGQYKFFHNQSVVVIKEDGSEFICHAFELKTGWKLINSKGELILISSIEKGKADRKWFKLTISGDRTFITQDAVVHNATRFWVGGGASANWNATGNTNWSATSGGANNATVPGASDDVTFNGLGGAGNSASSSTTITILSLTFTAGYTNTVTMNFNVTIAGNFTDNTAHSWAGTAGLTISAASTITSGGKTFPNNVTFSGTNTKVLSGNWTISGSLQISGTTVLNWTTNETISTNGLNASSNISGTAKIIITGGTWTAGTVQNNLDIAGNVTISANVGFNTGTLTYVSGTVTTTGSTLTIGTASTTLNTAGITWNNITTNVNMTLTLNSLLSVAGVFTLTANNILTFAGTAGFTVATLTASHTSSITISLKNGLTYNVTTAFNAFRSSTQALVIFASDHAANRAIFTLNHGATCNVMASFTRIDASGGRPILSFNGVITDSPNIFSYNDVKWIPVEGFARLGRRKWNSNRNKAVIYQ